MDDYRLSTPEQVDIHYTVAGLGSRFIALAIDTIIQWTVIITLVYSFFRAQDFSYEFLTLYSAFLIIALALVSFGYFVIAELLMKGRTPGKAVMKLRVVRKDGRAADSAGIVIRNLVRLIDMLPGLYTVGVISMFVTKDSCRLGDLAAGTLVVVEGKRANLEQVVSEQYQGTATNLSNQEYALVRDFLARRHLMTPAARQALAEKIARPICARITGNISHPNPEAFLESLMERSG